MNKNIILLIFGLFSVSVFPLSHASEESDSHMLPEWIRQVMLWHDEDKIPQKEFANFVKYVQNDIPENFSDSLNPLLEKRDSAYEQFLTRNNHHIVRVSEFQEYWGDSNSNQKLDEILSEIKKERDLLDRFHPSDPSVHTEFREVNDRAVEKLVSLLIDEYDLYIEQASRFQPIMNSLISQRDIAKQITATSFPDDGNHVELTVMLGYETESAILMLENQDTIPRERHNVKEVGENQNPIQVLYSVIKCQQELRVNGEDYIDSKIKFHELLQS